MLVEKENRSIQQKFQTGYSRKDSKLENRIKELTKSEIQRGENCETATNSHGGNRL